MKMKVKKVVSVLVVATLLVLNISSVLAQNNNENKLWEKRREYIEKKIIELGKEGPDQVDNWLAQNGLIKATNIICTSDGEGDFQIKSSPGDVNIYNIQGYYDSSAHKYLIKGWWTWKSIADVDISAGALDGVSLAMCKTDWNPVTGYVLASNPAGIAVYDQSGNHYPNAGSASKIDKSGIIYTFEDKWVDTKYCGYKGQVWLWMNTPPTQLPIYIKMDYEHTWTDATLSSFGFDWPAGSAPTINMQFSTTPSNFKIANQITLYSWPTD